MTSKLGGPSGEGLASVGSDDFASRAARVAQLEAEAEAIAALEDSAARTRRPGSPRKEPRLPPCAPFLFRFYFTFFKNISLWN